jgi:predicted small secreted protein
VKENKMKNVVRAAVLAAALALPLASCNTMVHKVGTGGGTGQQVEERQWYWLWGLAKINHVDSHAMADGATDYTVTTEQNVIDVIITFFTTWVSIVPFTETVQK